jgi:zinc transport system substrate-binding protein
MKRSLLMAILMGIFVFLFCPVVMAQTKMPVYVSFLPQKFFVESIGGNLVDVSVMVAPGANPHTYEPTPDQMKKLSSAKIYFAVGDPIEDTWLSKFSSVNPNMKIVHTEDGIEKKPIQRHERIMPAEADTDTGHAHEHGINDPHIWLSPSLVILQARNILVALADAAPEQRDFFEINYKKFIDQLIELDAALRIMFKDDENKQFIVFHPSWGYFADAYRLGQCSIEIEGKEPKAKEMTQLIQYAKNKSIKVILVQPQFSTKIAETIAGEISGRVVNADPLAENWMENIKSVAASIKQGLR